MINQEGAFWKIKTKTRSQLPHSLKGMYSSFQQAEVALVQYLKKREGLVRIACYPLKYRDP